ncbi:MAG: hypothetical protein AAB393_04600 [Bacteroidota bacterium]
MRRDSPTNTNLIQYVTGKYGVQHNIDLGNIRDKFLSGEEEMLVPGDFPDTAR